MAASGARRAAAGELKVMRDLGIWQKFQRTVVASVRKFCQNGSRAMLGCVASKNAKKNVFIKIIYLVDFEYCSLRSNYIVNFCKSGVGGTPIYL